MVNRCIIVLGLPRSGTSTVAGTLHRLGVDMGAGHWQPNDVLNPRGYYEDLRWQNVNKAIAGKRYRTEWRDTIGDKRKDQYRGVIRECNVKPLWGFKGPRLCFTLHHILPLLAEFDIDTRLVLVHREFDSVVSSIQRHSRIAYSGLFKMERPKAWDLGLRWKEAFEVQVKNFVGPTFTINYDDLLRDSYFETIALTEFVFNGLEQPPDADIQAATAWINPELNHFDDHDNHPDTE